MTEEPNIIKPHHCFCEIPDVELRPWVEKKYKNHLSTLELIKSTDDPHQKEIISIVALFDVDEKTLIQMMGNVNKPNHHIIHCRENVKHMLGIDTEN